MKIPGWLMRLMHRTPLSKGILSKLGKEDQIALAVADALREWTLTGRLKGLWWHTANEAGGGSDTNLRMIQTVKARALGMIAGCPDLVFIGPGEQFPAYDTFASVVLLVELKAPKGTMSPNQHDFAEWSRISGVTYMICRSLEDVEKALILAGLLTPSLSQPHK